MPKKVMVSGCFDLLHSGHIAFFESAAAYGELYVSLGSDRTVFELKGRVPVNTEDERLYMVKAVGCVKDAFVARGSGILDFEGDFLRLHPDVFGSTRKSVNYWRRLAVSPSPKSPPHGAALMERGLHHAIGSPSPA